MPGMDGTGPRGMGARTGRGRGICRKRDDRIQGFGYGCGLGRGMGRGRGFNRFAKTAERETLTNGDKQ